MNILHYVAGLQEQTGQLHTLLTGLTTKHLECKPEGKWSILEILEHILITERVVCSLLAKPSEEQSEKAELHGAEKLERLMVSLRERAVKAPETLAPKGLIKNCVEFELNFVELRNTLEVNLLTGKIMVDNRIHKHPLIGAMTISDWLAFLRYHTQRHIEQINDIVSKTGT